MRFRMNTVVFVEYHLFPNISIYYGTPPICTVELKQCFVVLPNFVKLNPFRLYCACRVFEVYSLCAKCTFSTYNAMGVLSICC